MLGDRWSKVALISVETELFLESILLVCGFCPAEFSVWAGPLQAMALKRPFSEEPDDDTMHHQQSKKQLTFQNAIRAVMHGLSLQEIGSKLEPLIRKVVREEVERGIQRFLLSQRPSFTQIESYGGDRCWHLHFVGKLPSTLFTNNKIESLQNGALKVVITDARSRSIITTGPLSSVKIEILVLDGDFGDDEEKDWSGQQFSARIVREREGKRPLLTGELTATLRNGVGCFSDVTFTDNSSWIRSRKFRLGAKAVQNDLGIREARTEPFVVKDHRGELYKKHHPPTLGDEIWRLEKIAKDGVFHNRLAAHGIHNLKDFLRLYYTNPSLLRNLLGGVNSTKIWETIILHATGCIVDDRKFFVYYGDAQKATGLLLNSVYKAVGAIIGGAYQPLDRLTESQKLLVKDLKQRACKNFKDFVEIDGSSEFDPSVPLWSTQAILCSPNLGPEHLEFPVTNLGQQETFLRFNPSTSSQSFQVEADYNLLKVSTSDQNTHLMQALARTAGNSFMLEDSCSGPSNEANGWAPSGLAGEFVLTNHVPAYENFHQAQASSWVPMTAAWGHGNNSLSASSRGAEFGIASSVPNFTVHISRCGRPKAGWCKIRAAFKWGISVRRNAAAKRMARTFLFVE